MAGERSGMGGDKRGQGYSAGGRMRWKSRRDVMKHPETTDAKVKKNFPR